MVDGTSAPQTSDYRLAPAFAARFVGVLLVALAVLLLLVTVLVAVLGLPGVTLLVVVVVGAGATLATAYVIAQRVAVVHLGPEGYRVRLVRGAGVTAAGWHEVEEAVTATPGGVPVVQLRLSGGRSTTIPVHALAVDREEFVRDLQRHLQHGQGLRPL